MAKKSCGYCGEPVDGFASVTVDGKQVWLCHPDDPDKFDCYSLAQNFVRPVQTMGTSCDTFTKTDPTAWVIVALSSAVSTSVSLDGDDEDGH